MSQIGKLIELIHVTLNETGRTDLVRSETVHPHELPGSHSPETCETVQREVRDGRLTTPGA